MAELSAMERVAMYSDLIQATKKEIAESLERIEEYARKLAEAAREAGA